MKGSYCLIIKMKKNKKIKIGKLGLIDFKKGFYVYVGSGMNNLEKRIERHLKRKKRIFWHIDYLLADEDAEIVRVLKKESEKKEECEIASKINGKPVPGFGCSDCKCGSHLFYFPDEKSMKLEEWMG